MKNCTPLWCEAHFEVKKCTKHPLLGALLEDEMFKKRTALWCESHFEVRMRKAHQVTRFGALLEVEMSKKCTPFWREAHFQSKCEKTLHARTTFEGSDVVLRGRRKRFCPLPKVSKTGGFCGIFKNDGRRGTFEEDLERCISRGRRSTRDMFIRNVGRSGRCFPERGCILEHQIFRFAKMILRDDGSGKIAICIGTRPSALH